jgi:hypothetical protein
VYVVPVSCEFLKLSEYNGVRHNFNGALPVHECPEASSIDFLHDLEFHCVLSVMVKWACLHVFECLFVTNVLFQLGIERVSLYRVSFVGLTFYGLEGEARGEWLVRYSMYPNGKIGLVYPLIACSAVAHGQPTAYAEAGVPRRAGVSIGNNRQKHSEEKDAERGLGRDELNSTSGVGLEGAEPRNSWECRVNIVPNMYLNKATEGRVEEHLISTTVQELGGKGAH